MRARAAQWREAQLQRNAAATARQVELYGIASGLRFGRAGRVVVLHQHPGRDASNGSSADTDRVGRIHDSAPRRRNRSPGRCFLFFFFLLFSAAGLVSSRVVSWPCASVTTFLPSLMVRSPLRAKILTVPSTSVTLNSVHAFDAGVTFTSPAVAAIPFEVDTVTLAVLNVHRRAFELHQRVG